MTTMDIYLVNNLIEYMDKHEKAWERSKNKTAQMEYDWANVKNMLKKWTEDEPQESKPDWLKRYSEDYVKEVLETVSGWAKKI